MTRLRCRIWHPTHRAQSMQLDYCRVCLSILHALCGSATLVLPGRILFLHYFVCSISTSGLIYIKPYPR